MLKVKNSKGQWVNIEEVRLAQKIDKQYLDEIMHKEPIKEYVPEEIIEPILKVPPMTREESEEFIEMWTKVSKESNIELIDDEE